MSADPQASPCKARHINHVCIAVKDIEETLAFYRNVFGTGEAEVEDIEDQAVRAALVRVGGSQLEFIEPTDPEGGVARFIERRGEGLHCLQARRAVPGGSRPRSRYGVLPRHAAR